MGTFSPRRRCLNNPNVFSCICGEHTLQSNRKGISEFVKCVYLAYFKVMLGDQNKAWALYIVCKQCVEHLRLWTKKDRKSLCFGIPVVLREPTRWHSGLSVRFVVGRLGVYFPCRVIPKDFKSIASLLGARYLWEAVENKPASSHIVYLGPGT